MSRAFWPLWWFTAGIIVAWGFHLLKLQGARRERATRPESPSGQPVPCWSAPRAPARAAGAAGPLHVPWLHPEYSEYTARVEYVAQVAQVRRGEAVRA